MYAFTVKTRKQLERASLRAQAQKPRIQEVEFGVYNVWSTDPKKPNTFYGVGIQPAQDGGYEVMCSCPTQNYFCKHVAAVFPHYLLREKQQAALVAAQSQVQEMTDAEWAEVELAVETEAMLDEVREMLERDREREEYTEEMARRDHLDLFGF